MFITQSFLIEEANTSKTDHRIYEQNILCILTKHISIFFVLHIVSRLCTCLGWSTAFCGSVLTLLLGWLVTFVTGCLKIEAVCRTGRDVFRSGFPYTTHSIVSNTTELFRVGHTGLKPRVSLKWLENTVRKQINHRMTYVIIKGEKCKYKAIVLLEAWFGSICPLREKTEYKSIQCLNIIII